MNDEARISNDEGNQNDETQERGRPLSVFHSSFVILSSFVIRISAFISVRGSQLIRAHMKLSRTVNYNFSWLVFIGLVDVAFLLVFFLLLSSNFILQQGIS